MYIVCWLVVGSGGVGGIVDAQMDRVKIQEKTRESNKQLFFNPIA